jgi:hypothetical protein
MSIPPPATVPIAPALADLAFASASDSQVSRSLAWTSPVDLGIDLNDPAQRRFGDYELLELIGQGGMGAVYRAHQHNLDREVALKFLAAGPWASDEFIARFRREAQAAARMQHPNIVEIHDTGVRDGLYYFSMRLVKGETLAERLRAKGPMAIRQAATMMRTIAEAIDYAHRLGVLHLDLKPGNVLLGERDEPLVADFGLARRIDEGPHADHDNVSGTPSYMAPEQATAKSSGIGPAADIYGLGAILYEMLVGEPPFRGRDVKDTLRHVLNDEPTAPRTKRHDIPADLDAICLKCLAKEPAQRYASARELGDELGRFIGGDPVTARSPTWLERLRRWVERNRWQTVAYIVFAGGLALSITEMRAAMLARESAEAHRLRAEQASERSTRLSTLFAHAFAVPKDRGSRDALEDSARRVVQWLRDNLAGNEVAQSEVLLELIDDLEGADNPHAAQALVWPIIELLGEEHRRQVAQEHLGRGTLRGKLLGASLLRDADVTEEEKAAKLRLLGELLQEAPADLDVLAAVTFHCSASVDACRKLDPAIRLAQLQPDNAANWAYALRAEHSADEAAVILRKAAAASSFDDHFTRVFGLAPEAIETSQLDIPPVLEAAIGRMNDTVGVRETLGWYQSWSLPLPNWHLLIRTCKPDGMAATDAQLRADCLNVAERAARSTRSILTSMIGATVIRHLRPGTEEADRARDLRRDYVYTYDMLGERTPAQLRASRDELMARETITFGELEASKRALDRAGIPRNPPPDWEPSDPTRLMTGLEREIYRERALQLARQPLLPLP